VGKWSARLAAKTAAPPSAGTDKTDKSPLLAVLAVPREGGTRIFEPPANDAAASSANQFELHFRTATALVVGFAPAVQLAEVLRQFPSAIAAVEVATTVPSCHMCRHASRHGNCGEPVAAGLSDRFELVPHPDGGRECRVFRCVGPEPVDPRNAGR
jgi:hypothetical protein